MDLPKFIQANVSLKEYNTWKVGGVAEFLSLPNTVEDIKTSINWAKENKYEITLLGDGSNVLIHDEGIKGLVICLKKINGVEGTEENGNLKIECWAGSSKAEALKIFLKYKLSPALFLTGLPGNIAGGVVMNAGVGEQRVPREFCEIVEWVDVLRPESLEIERVKASDINWSYRTSKGWQPGIVVKVGLIWPLNPEHPEIMKEIKKATRNRIMKQPINQPSCGSVFRNPKPQSSGALIEGAGLKGFSIGGAQVSKKHANFIVTEPGAKASDVDLLIKHVQKTISEKHSIDLHTEVVYLGY